jgi:probable phosphoglycerate mutase
MRRILLIRHGESEHHVRGMTGGWTDLPLTDVGREQAERTALRVAELVGGESVSVFSSDLVRAVMTAEEIGHALGIPIERIAGLREFNNGAAAGLTKAAASKLELPRTDNPTDWQPYPGAETWRGMTSRVISCLDGLRPRSGSIAVIVSHANSATAVVRWWLGITDLDRNVLSFEFDSCSITDLTLNEWGEATIHRLNDVSHL